jgi:hypothetical protein
MFQGSDHTSFQPIFGGKFLRRVDPDDELDRGE